MSNVTICCINRPCRLGITWSGDVEGPEYLGDTKISPNRIILFRAVIMPFDNLKILSLISVIFPLYILWS